MSATPTHYRVLFVCRRPCRRQLLRDTLRIPARPDCPACGQPMIQYRTRKKGGKPGDLRRRIIRLLGRRPDPVSTADIGFLCASRRKNPRKTVYSLLRGMLAAGEVRRVSSSKQAGAYWVI